MNSIECLSCDGERRVQCGKQFTRTATSVALSVKRTFKQIDNYTAEARSADDEYSSGLHDLRAESATGLGAGTTRYLVGNLTMRLRDLGCDLEEMEIRDRVSQEVTEIADSVTCPIPPNN